MEVTNVDGDGLVVEVCWEVKLSIISILVNYRYGIVGEHTCFLATRLPSSSPSSDLAL